MFAISIPHIPVQLPQVSQKKAETETKAKPSTVIRFLLNLMVRTFCHNAHCPIMAI